MPCTAGHDILVADDVSSFVDAIINAYTNNSLWNDLASRGPVSIENAYGQIALARQVDELFRAVADSTNQAVRSQIP